MSRIGRAPINIPAGVTVNIADNVVTVKGPNGELKQHFIKPIEIRQEDGRVLVTRPNDEKQNRALHGLYRNLVFNMVKGVTEGYQKNLMISGVGFKATQNGKKLVLNVGYSHPVEFEQPEGVEIAIVSPTEVSVKGIDKVLVGQTAANIRAIRKPEPYHGYGIRYKDEVIFRKEGKKSGK
jgi:large subunit ribosomal protein L6